MTPSPNRVALFLDGTWNTTHDNTNVWRLKSLCAQTDCQKVYYNVGVGTQKGEKISGGMFGIGINEEVVAAYEWLVEHCAPGDRIFIFGFSRGAFTARSLAGFVSKCGLLKPGSPLSMKSALRAIPQGLRTLHPGASEGRFRLIARGQVAEKVFPVRTRLVPRSLGHRGHVGCPVALRAKGKP